VKRLDVRIQRLAKRDRRGAAMLVKVEQAALLERRDQVEAELLLLVGGVARQDRAELRLPRRRQGTVYFASIG
jgi:hypothetical protein